MKRILALVTLCLAGIVGSAQAELPPDYKIFLQTENFPPYNFSIDGKNFARGEKINGISVDIVKEMFKRAGIKYSLTLRFPWSRIYDMTLERPNYGVFSMVRSSEREALFTWVGPLAPDEWVFLARNDSTIRLNSLADAKKYKVGGYRGDAIAEYLTDEGFDNLDLSFQDKFNAQKLTDGKIDLWASNNYSGLFLAKQEGVSGLRKIYTFDLVDLFLGLNPNTPKEAVDRLQSALDQMRSDDTIDRIISSYIQ